MLMGTYKEPHVKGPHVAESCLHYVGNICRVVTRGMGAGRRVVPGNDDYRNS